MTRRAVWAVATALFVLALPLALILSAVRFVFSWQPVYTYAVREYHAEATTGIPASELIAATRQIREYFSNDQRDLDISVAGASGQPQPLFNDREIAHMRDVKVLVSRAYLVLDGAVLVSVAYAAASVVRRRRDAIRRLAAATLTDSLLTSLLLLAFGLASLFGFDQLFTAFHVISFSNNFWELDPATDHLVQIFPLGFWFDVTMFVGLLALFAAVTLAALSGTALRLTLRPRPAPIRRTEPEHCRPGSC